MRERFMNKLRENPETGCWDWTACITSNGYGQFGVGRTVHYAHRVAYELFIGPIPEGLQIDHLCRNRACVNPEHLEAVTQRTNILRGTAPPAECVDKTHCKRGHEFTGANTYRRPDGSRECITCRTLRREGAFA